MEKILTIKEALEQGYEYYLHPSTSWQTLNDILDAQQDVFEDNPDAEIFLADKKPLHPTSLSSDDIAEFLAEFICENHSFETGCDDTNDIYDAIKGIDFSEVSNKIDDALKSFTYHAMTNIRLKP